MSKKLRSILNFILGFALLLSGCLKLLDPYRLVDELNSIFSFLSDDILLTFVCLLSFFELLLGLFLFYSIFNNIKHTMDKFIGLGVFSVFSIFLLYSLFLLAVKKEGSCGCFGSALETPYGWSMVLRNLLLFLLSSIRFFLKFDKQLIDKNEMAIN